MTNDKWNDESIKKGPTSSRIFYVKMSNFCPSLSQMIFLLPFYPQSWGSECWFWENKSFEVVTLGSGTVTISCRFHFHISGAVFSFEGLQIKPGGPLTSLLWEAQIEKSVLCKEIRRGTIAGGWISQSADSCRRQFKWGPVTGWDFCQTRGHIDENGGSFRGLTGAQGDYWLISITVIARWFLIWMWL